MHGNLIQNKELYINEDNPYQINEKMLDFYVIFLDLRRSVFMKNMDIQEHYHKFYEYPKQKESATSRLSGKERKDKVTSLYDAVMRNDKNALEEVILLVSDPGFWIVYNKLLSHDARYHSLVFIDDLMQDIRMKIVKKAHRGFVSKKENTSEVEKNNFYMQLLGIFEHSVLESVRKNWKTEGNWDSYEEKVEIQGDFLVQKKEGKIVSPESNLFLQEKEKMQNTIVGLFIKRLADSSLDPHKIVTYCYTSLLPLVFKSSRRPEFLAKVNDISGRNGQKKTSGYSYEDGVLYGEIMRNSTVLLNWALDAMYGENVDFLQGECAGLYNEEPLADTKLVWGEDFRQNLEKYVVTDKKEKEIIITDDFGGLNIKNWSIRVQMAVYKKMEKDLFANDRFLKESVDYVKWDLRR